VYDGCGKEIRFKRTHGLRKMNRLDEEAFLREEATASGNPAGN